MCIHGIAAVEVRSQTIQADSHLANDSVTVGEKIFNNPDSIMLNKTDRKIFYQGKLLGSAGFGSQHSTSLGLDIVNSISFSNVAAIGVGAGMRLPIELKVMVVPVYLDFRLILSQNEIAPMVEVAWGGTFQSNQNYEYIGQILNVQAGMKIEGKQNLSYIITMGYEEYDMMKPPKTVTTGSYYMSSYRTKPKKATIYSITLNFAILF